MESICRLCLTKSSQMKEDITEAADLINKIWSCLSVRISSEDQLPKQICLICSDKLNDIFTYRQKVLNNQNLLQYYYSISTNALKNFIKQTQDPSLKDVNIHENKENKLLNTWSKEKVEENSCITNILSKEIKIENCDINDEATENYSSDDDLALSSIQKTKEEEARKNSLPTIIKLEKSIDKNEESNVQRHAFKESNYKCLTCFETFNKQHVLLKHYSEKHVSKNVANGSPNLSYVISREGGNVMYKCLKCDKNYDTRRGIKRHSIVHIEDRPFLCKVCGRTYKTASEIVRHGRVHGDTKMTCSYLCGYSTVYLASLKAHERRHRTEYKFKCEECGKGFQVQTWYEQHQNVHKGVKPYVCNICGLSFHMDRYLKSHRSSVHPQSSRLKRFICLHCSLPCDSKRTLTEHMKVHGVKKYFLCDLCGKTLSGAEQLRNHTKVHLSVKRFTCSLCSKSFVKKFNLTVHLRAHAGARPYACACGRRYSQRSALNRHRHNRCHTGSAFNKSPLVQEDASISKANIDK